MDNYMILQAVLAITSIIVTGILIPLVKSKIDKDKLDKAVKIAEIAVQSAEQIYYIGGMGQTKFDYAFDFIKSFNLGLSDEQIESLIESAVKELNLWQEEIRK